MENAVCAACGKSLAPDEVYQARNAQLLLSFTICSAEQCRLDIVTNKGRGYKDPYG
jgi:hypothetical protein